MLKASSEKKTTIPDSFNNCRSNFNKKNLNWSVQLMETAQKSNEIGKNVSNDISARAKVNVGLAALIYQEHLRNFSLQK